ncbi:Mitotic spindle assembly checkpoint protein MAD2B [Acipenser ruthenus]|uniref:Mitotic spindle assembly checkpoint protein MAD2B n=1 Tax=Acipenser ruthenus TaxID=7906 RepID=A0A444UTV8_ACIRT|nr:Mitotic spindle assembly checkpoint protein MAD2B [Acipenser ruthenus]
MTTLTRQDLNFGQVVADILCEFLEVAIHLILYVREVYPSGIFQKRKKYSVPVQMSCHPELNQYIQDTLHCIKPLIVKDFPWIVADEQEVHMREPRLIPLKTMTSDIVKVREIH